MAIEKKWPAVAPRLFTANGTTLGIITLSDTKGFKVKQKVVITSNTKPDLQLQVKRVNKTTLIVGPFPTKQGEQSLTKREDISAYLVSDSAYVYAEEQDKATLKPDDIIQAVYDQEPATAIRTVFVDEHGDYYDDTNPLPIAFDGTVEIGTVSIKDADGDELAVNDDGSLNVNIVSAPSSNKIKNVYDEATSVPSGTETTIAQYTVPELMNSAYLQRISVTGENIARYQVFINDELFDTRRTYFSNLNENFEFCVGAADGVFLVPGDVVVVKCLHNRPDIADFAARIQVFEIN